MDDPLDTSWSLLESAEAGDSACRQRFAEVYGPLVERYLRRALRVERSVSVADAVQEVFLECFRVGGVLERVAENRPDSFRGFLFGVVRNVTLRMKEKRARSPERDLEDGAFREPIGSDGDMLALFEREWARSMVSEALKETVRERWGTEQDRRRGVELLRLRFEEGLPIRDVARIWGDDPVRVHRLYATVRGRFHSNLRAVVGRHEPNAEGRLEEECRWLLTSLG